MTKPGTLVLVRHGQSEWNALNMFSGWVDVDLTEKGRAEATRAGQLLAEHGLLPDRLYTSVLRRTITTAQIMLNAAERHSVSVRRSWRLNERHYGALQGLNRAEVRQKYGEEQFALWRRSYNVSPPPIEPDSRFSQRHDVRYAHINGGPSTECLADVIARLIPYYTDVVVPDLRDGKTVLIAAHGNSLRALVKYLDSVSDEDIVEVNIPTGVPLRYDFDADFKPLVAGGVYLDPEAASAGAAAVAVQGSAVAG
jgi:2,3-bisphosphoglycerate-dependent phosphoglycerate mutase